VVAKGDLSTRITVDARVRNQCGRIAVGLQLVLCHKGAA
jgi:hypothetical protein